MYQLFTCIIPVVQDRVLAVWFRDKLALSFGVVVSVIRLGSVLNFLVTSHISLKYGLETALWIGRFSTNYHDIRMYKCIIKK